MKKRIKMLIPMVLVLALLMACTGGELKSPSGVSGDKNEPAKAAITIAETVLYDKGGVKVTATGFEKSYMGQEVKLLVENDSAKTLIITSDAVSVNGYMMPISSFYVEIAAGKKANESLHLLSSELEKSGIDTVAQIQFYIEVRDADDWQSTARSDLLTLSTSAAPYEQVVDDSGDVLYDKGGIRVVCKGLKQDVIWDGTVVFFMENNTGKEVYIYAENVSVNGFMQTASLWSTLRSGTKIIDGMSMINLSDIQIESIDQIKSIEFNLRIVDADTFKEIATTDVLTLNFE